MQAVKYGSVWEVIGSRTGKFKNAIQFYQWMLDAMDQTIDHRTLGPRDDGVAEWNQCIIERNWYKNNCKSQEIDITNPPPDPSTIDCKQVNLDSVTAFNFPESSGIVATDEIGKPHDLVSCLAVINWEQDQNHKLLKRRVLALYFDYREPGAVTYRRIHLVDGWNVSDCWEDLERHEASFQLGWKIDEDGLRRAVTAIIGELI